MQVNDSVDVVHKKRLKENLAAFRRLDLFPSISLSLSKWKPERENLSCEFLKKSRNVIL
jgi:hypothetical protein